MKKKKTQKRSTLDPDNNSFQGTKITAPLREETLVDDAALFMRAVHGARVINPPYETQSDEINGRAAEKNQGGDRDEQQLFLRAIRQIGATSRDELPKADGDERRRRSASSRIRQLKRGTIALSDELDLHGYVKKEALKRLEQFIAGAYSKGQQAVLVITGKGINSAVGPVLQGAVAAWLREEGRGLVAEVAPAPRDKGGSGAFVVFLKIR
jgi:DNA-nicking Smr family endonuclease